LTLICFVGSAALAERAFLGLYVPSTIVKDDRSSHARLSRMALESRDVAVETPARLEAPEITRTSPAQFLDNKKMTLILCIDLKNQGEK
jgi:hypothetical protein